MGLRFSFRHLFYGGKIHKDRLYKILEDLDSSSGGEPYDDTEIKKDIKDNSDAITALEARVKALEDAQTTPEESTPLEDVQTTPNEDTPGGG